MSEKTYEMMWDCEFCGTKKLLGKTHRFCAECGAPQNPEKRYYPPENEKVAVEDHQFVGADVHCPSCQETQSAAAKHCANCGADIAGGKQAARVAEHVVGVGGAVATAPKKKSKVGCILAVVGVLIVGVIAFFVVNRFWTQTAKLEVTKREWRREIKIEKFGKVKDDGPCKDVPKNAKILSRSTPKKKCKTRKIDQGDGTFKEKKECDKPTEQCTYEAEKWKVVRTLKEEGGVDDDPKWPKSKVGKKKKKCAGCEREGDRVESFIVHLEDRKSKEDHTCVFRDEKKWKKFEKGSTWVAETGMLTGDLKCDKLTKK